VLPTVVAPVVADGSPLLPPDHPGGLRRRIRRQGAYSCKTEQASQDAREGSSARQVIRSVIWAHTYLPRSEDHCCGDTPYGTDA
jgi:hypothetical protein